MTPMKAIRAKCLDCSCGSAQEVRLCPVKDCPLYPYRFGKNPKRAGIGGKINSAQAKTPRLTEQNKGETLAIDELHKEVNA